MREDFEFEVDEVDEAEEVLVKQRYNERRRRHRRGRRK